MRVLDLFAGIGGFSLGLERAGMRTVAFCESDEKCRRVLARHWPRVPIYPDARTLDARTLERGGIIIDLLSAGFPCQPFSSAARGRNNKPDLWPEVPRLVRGLRPDWVLGENVPGLGPHGVERVCRDLETEGYRVWAFDVDTAPPGRQRERRRFIFVANANGQGQPRRPLDAEVARISDLPRCREEDHSAPVGVDDGLPGRMDRLRQLGNAVSPWFTERLGRAVMAAQLQKLASH